MANPDFNPMHEKPGGGGMKNSARKAKSAGFNEKPGFPSASLPGKSQPRDRSNGIKRAKVSPDRKGL